jgi:integrase
MDYEEYLTFLTESNMSVHTVNDYRSTYKRFFFTYNKLNEVHIRAFLGTAKAATTKRKYIVQFKSLAEFFDVKIDWKKIPAPKIRNEAPLTMTEQHERRLVNYIDRRDHKAARMVTFLLETGLRISELCALEPKHYRIVETSTSSAYHALKIGTDMDTHSIDGRWVPLSRIARNIIEEFGLPFDIDRRRFNDLLVAARTSLGLPDYKIHSLRKTFMSRCLKRNMDVTVVANIMGHKALGTMLAYADREIETVCDAFNQAA